MSKTLIVAGCLLALAGGASAISWSDFDGLVGQWQGSGSDSGGSLQATHTWEWIYGGKFLRLSTELTVLAEDGSRETRQNVGYMSYDNDRNAFVFRQFFSAGYVATYDVLVQEGGKVIDFGERAAESGGGIRARMVITFEGDDSYHQELELAMPREEFATRQTLDMKR